MHGIYSKIYMSIQHKGKLLNKQSQLKAEWAPVAGSELLATGNF